MNAAWTRPPVLTRMIHHSKSTWPPWTKKMFRSAVTTTMNASGAMERSAPPNGMRASAKNAMTNAAHTASPQNVWATNTTAISTSASTSFARASMRCTGLDPGQ